MSENSKDTNDKKEKDHGYQFEIIWRNILIVIVGIFLYCIPGFMSFKEKALEKGVYFIPNSAWIWTAVGFVAFGVLMLSYRP